MSNKNRGFVRQITIKEMRSRFYRAMGRELATGQSTPTPNTGVAPEDEDMSLSDPTEHYRIPKTHSSSQDLGEWLNQNREDPALRVSLRGCGLVFYSCP
jgi:hypothetical protein